jgi:hypothetical protein
MIAFVRRWSFMLTATGRRVGGQKSARLIIKRDGGWVSSTSKPSFRGIFQGPERLYVEHPSFEISQQASTTDNKIIARHNRLNSMVMMAAEIGILLTYINLGYTTRQSDIN